MNFKELEAWVEANPGKSILIGGGLVLFLLWIFGAFSKSATSNGGSLAAAYYAAEAQQAVIGGQIQQATIAAAAQTAQAGIAANAATAINAANTNAAITINQNQGVVVSHLADQQLNATLSNNATIQNVNATNTAAALAAHEASINGAEALAYINTVIPQELKITGGFGNFFLPNGQALSVNTGSPVGNVDLYQSIGFTPNEATQLALADLSRQVPNVQPDTSRGFPENLLGNLQFPG